MTTQSRIMLRPLGNPLPLGFLALAAATLLVSGLQLEWLEPSDGAQVALVLIAFVFPLQLVATAVLATTALRFATTGIYQLTAADDWKAVTGVIGLILCAFAVYAALAMALEEAFGRTALPLGRRAAIDGEPGVRGQL